MPAKLTTAYRLSALIAVLAAFQAAAGLLWPQIYRDNALVNAVWRGNDAVTLIVAVPLLAGALALAQNGSPRAVLVWAGLLDYMLYNYAFYLFGAAFNRLFLVFAALVALSMFALIFLLARLDVPALARQFGARTPVRAAALYLLAVAVALGGLWSAMSLGYVVTGQLPGPVVSAGHPTAIVFALDLTLAVPAMALAGVWLWQRRAWGYVLGAVLCIKGALYMLALSAGSLSAMLAGIPGAGGELVIWGSVGLGALAAAYALLRHVGPAAVARDYRRQARLKAARQ